MCVCVCVCVLITGRTHCFHDYMYIYIYTVDSRYNEPRRKTKNSSLYREFVKSKIEKNLEFLLKYLKNPV